MHFAEFYIQKMFQQINEGSSIISSLEKGRLFANHDIYQAYLKFSSADGSLIIETQPVEKYSNEFSVASAANPFSANQITAHQE